MREVAKEREFGACMERMFQIVLKWSKKTKHTLFCYRLFARLVCFGSYDFYAKHDVMALLIQVIIYEPRTYSLTHHVCIKSKKKG